MPHSVDSSSFEPLTIDLPVPLPASDDCLPHAAMGLGSHRAVGTNPGPGLVHRIVIQPQMTAWCVFRLDDHGGFVGETWHPDRDDAVRTVCAEFHLDADNLPLASRYRHDAAACGQGK